MPSTRSSTWPISGNVRVPANIIGEGIGHFRDRTKVVFSDRLDGEPVLNAIRVADHADYRPGLRWHQLPVEKCWTD